MFVRKNVCMVMSGGMRVRDGLEWEDLLSITIPCFDRPFFLIFVFSMNSDNIRVSYIAGTESNHMNRKAFWLSFIPSSK